MTTDTDLWTQRKARAIAWMDAWRAERDEAVKKRRPMKYIAYDYTAPRPQAARAKTQEER